MLPEQIQQKLDLLVQHADDIRAVFPLVPENASDVDIMEIRGLLLDHMIYVEHLRNILYLAERHRLYTKISKEE